MKKTQVFTSEAEAQTFASANGGTIRTNEVESFSLPASFWTQLESSSLGFAATIRAHAKEAWNGSLEAAWDDALEGNIRGVPAPAMLALDQQFRTRVASTHWIVEYDDGKPQPQFYSASIDAGMPGNEDAAWGSSSSDGWMVDMS